MRPRARPEKVALRPFLTLVLPTLDEEDHIEDCVRALLDDPYPRDRLEIFIVDGGSTDRTVEIARDLAYEFPFLRVLYNPRRLQAPGFNMALQFADRRAEYVMRCDVHAEYPSGFMTRATQALERSGAAVATYGDAPKGRNCFQTAVAFAQNTPLGVGHAWYRLGGISGFVEHGKHGCFRRDALEAVGGYDEDFSHNEDSELSHRLIQAGGKIWLDADLTVGYYPRPTPAALARQYFHYGRGRAQTIAKHRIMPRLRQMAPALLVAAEAFTLPFALLSATGRDLLLLGASLYLAPLFLMSILGALRQRDACVALAPLALTIMHHSWGFGFLLAMAQKAGRAVANNEGMASRNARY